MDKYTLKTVFQKSFLGLIWRIEADTANGVLAIETRNRDQGTPSFSVVDYTTGVSLIHEIPYGDRHWTLAGIIEGKLIVRAFGTDSPDHPGIACLDAFTGNLLWEQFNYTLLGIANRQLIVRHRSFAAGYEQYLAPSDGNLTQFNISVDKPIGSAVVLPRTYTADVPTFLKNYAVYGDIFYCQVGLKHIWAFHEKDGQAFRVRLVVSSGRAILADVVVLANLVKMTPEVFFMIDQLLFIISDNKQEIVSYLV
ncbi:DUF4905 domain-containing protein [Parapedobacter sp. ISTM3]|uniref:DUF4905 domain-containing protein n=1 Tax=Parapedobacter sp. ISTM3 TaxID=2800130 RepID=UPI0019082D8E|nr:DUF4905 domain-containing protein [Parapedobacter sp. ISTM3]MBK1441970.1 DUF4905 domain-containing protein [Parapedobacter sp. ISTM3]